MSRIPSLVKHTSPNLFVPRVSWEGDPSDGNKISSAIAECSMGYSSRKITGVNRGTVSFYVTLQQIWPKLYWNANYGFPFINGFYRDFTCNNPFDEYGFVELTNGSSFTANYGDVVTFGVEDRSRGEEEQTVNLYTYTGSPSAQLFVTSFVIAELFI